MYKQYAQLKNQIMGDKMLSAEGKRLKLKELQDKAKESLSTDMSLNKVSAESVKEQIKTLKKQKFTKTLPTVDVPEKEYLTTGEKVLATLLGQQVALMAEQRMSERLVTKLSMESDHGKFASIIDDCLYEQFGPSAIVRAMPQIKVMSERLQQTDRAVLRLAEVYAKAIDNEKDAKEKAWEVAHGEELNKLESRNHELTLAGISLNNTNNIFINEDAKIQQEKYFSADIQSDEGSGYFNHSQGER